MIISVRIHSETLINSTVEVPTRYSFLKAASDSKVRFVKVTFMLRGQWPQELILEVLDDGVIVIWSHSLWYTGPATHRWGPIVPTARTTVTKMAKRTGHTNLSCGTVWLGNSIRTWYLLGVPLLLDSHGSLAPSMYNPIVRHEASFDILVHA